MKYHSKTVAIICDGLKMGVPQKYAAEAAGISEETFYAWKKKYPKFVKEILRAEAECVRRNLSIIQKAAIDNWHAAAWWLERRKGEEFAPRSREQIEEEIKAKGKSNIVVEIVDNGRSEPLRKSVSEVEC